MHLAAAADDLEDLGPHRGAVAAVLLRELAERGGVEVEPLHPDPDLVVTDRRVGVQPLGGLGQRTQRLEHAVHAHRITRHAPHSPHAFLSRLDQTRDIAAMRLLNRKILSILSQEGQQHTITAPGEQEDP